MAPPLLVAEFAEKRDSGAVEKVLRRLARGAASENKAAESPLIDYPRATRCRAYPATCEIRLRGDFFNGSTVPSSLVPCYAWYSHHFLLRSLNKLGKAILSKSLSISIWDLLIPLPSRDGLRYNGIRRQRYPGRA